MAAFSARDHEWMTHALRLAERGMDTTTPNPRVGCVLIADDRVVGQGWHERAGEAHAEVHALRAAGSRARGATAYVTLEPCAHHGRTPPCSDALLVAGVGRVVAAMPDPNPEVSGRGLARLAEAGIRVDCGLLETQAQELNCGFVSRMTRGRPWLRLKTAASVDGRTALGNGISQWITGEHARRDGQRWRARSCAILTGVGTVLGDDPRLSVRLPDHSRQPARVVVDSTLRTPPGARLFDGGKVIVACTMRDSGRAAMLEAQGAEVLVLPGKDGRVDLWALMRELASRGFNEVLAEGGQGLSGALIRAGCVDEIVLYLAATILGSGARGMFEFAPLERLEDAGRWLFSEARAIGPDLRLRLRPAEA